MDVFETILNTKLVPVVVFKDLNNVDETLLSLTKGDVPVAEICFRTECAEQAIKIATEKFPNMLIGAGTVINEEQATRAIQAGAKFIVSPGISEKVFEVCQKNNIPYLPGVITPTEIMKALELGLTYLKFFPSGVFGGLKAIKALSAPFPQVKFMPTGGVDNNNLSEFVQEKCIFAIGGSWLLKGDITNTCLEARKIVKGE